MYPLRYEVTNPEPAWSRTQFAPAAVYHEVWNLKRAVAELQEEIKRLRAKE